MHQKLRAVLILVLVFVIILCLHTPESFATGREKASTIHDWFQKNSSPTYTKYRADIGPGSNIVEYEDVLRLKQSGNLTLDSVKKITT